MSKEKNNAPRNWDVGIQPFAFTTAQALWKPQRERDRRSLSNYRWNFHGVSSGIPAGEGGLSSFGSIYLSGDESKLRRETKKPFPPSGRNGQLSQNDC
jgi:hypothetical protein